MEITTTTINAFKEHALAEYPKEACGVIIAGNYTPCTNTASDPSKQFKISAEEIVRLESEQGLISAILHSHPYQLADRQKWDPRWPTTTDMASWIRSTIPWGIASTDGEGISELCWLDETSIAPLEGREFIHGIHDCYSLVRDYFRLERKVHLPNYPRGIECWNNGEDLYSENFKAAGFSEIAKTEARTGDCCLFQVASPVINHAAVISGHNEILHHLFHRLSGKDRLDRWDRQIVKYVRYVGSEQ